MISIAARYFWSGTLAGGLLCAGLILSGPAIAQTQATSATAGQNVTVPSVTVTDATMGEVVNRTPLSGTLVALREVLVYPQVSGFPIDSLMVEIGTRVEKGDTLAQINTDTLQAKLAQSRAELARAEAGVRQAESQISSAEASAQQAASVLTRTRQLDQSGNVTQAALDQAIANSQTADAAAASARDGVVVAQAQLQQAQAQLEIAQLDLDHATVKAPSAGIVSARNAQIGAIATSGAEPLFRLIEDGVIEVEAQIIETALAGITEGDPADLDIAGVGQAAGEVRLISPTVDAQNRLGTVRVSITEGDNLRTGLYAGGWIVTDRREGVTVPVTAVLTDASGDYVLEVQDGKVVRRDVTAGLIWEDRREILEGVQEGAVVVARASAFFADGDAVNPVRAKAQDGKP